MATSKRVEEPNITSVLNPDSGKIPSQPSAVSQTVTDSPAPVVTASEAPKSTPMTISQTVTQPPAPIVPPVVAKTEPVQHTPARKFRTKNSQVGPFPKNHTFSEKEFIALHPLPAEPELRARIHRVETYHADLIARLRDDLKVIEDAPYDAVCDITPVGPENGVTNRMPYVNPAIASNNAVLAELKSLNQNIKAMAHG